MFGLCSIFWIFRFMSFGVMGIFSSHYFFRFSFLVLHSLSSFWDSNGTNANTFLIITQVSKALFVVLLLFLSLLIWMISTNLFSTSLFSIILILNWTHRMKNCILGISFFSCKISIWYIICIFWDFIFSLVSIFFSIIYQGFFLNGQA